MNIQKVDEFLNIYMSRRRVGHTKLMLEGANDTTVRHGLVFANHMQAKNAMIKFWKPGAVKPVIFTLDSDLRYLGSFAGPLAIDNAAIVELLRSARRSSSNEAYDRAFNDRVKLQKELRATKQSLKISDRARALKKEEYEKTIKDLEAQLYYKRHPWRKIKRYFKRITEMKGMG